MKTLPRAATPFLQEVSDPDFTDPAAAFRMTGSAESDLRDALETSNIKDAKSAMPQSNLTPPRSS